SNPTASDPWASPQTSTFYWVIAEDSLGCRDSNGISVIVRETPEAFAMAIEETLYTGQTLELRGFPIDSTYSYTWEGPNDFISESRIVIIDSLTLDHGGWYFLIVGNSIGCSDIDSVFIEILTYPRMPEISIAPSILLLDVYEDEISDEATVVIANTGDSTLFVSAVYSEAGIPEFSIDDISPIDIEPGISESLEVTFSASIIGTYFDTLIIESNDPHEAVSKIVMRGRVHPPEDPAISAFPDILDFGTVQLDSCTKDSVYYTNSGGGLLVINSVTPQVPTILHLRPPLPDTLTIGAGAYYVFEFCPVLTGSLHTWIDTETNDPDDNIFQLLALGLCVKHSGYAVTTEVITPNTDGLNDEIEFIIPDDVTSWNVEIYNSKGNLVTSGQISRWDAHKDGAPLPIGTYYYRITSENETRLSGAISIIY
ncbi:MAG: gliding motility-associated C-terminal domain-containing protein, partial [bacterium]